MIYTVTFNPALDYAVFVSELQVGKTNRSTSEILSAGGKGINVSAVLGALGTQSVALGFVAGFTGKAIEEMTAKMGVTTDFIEVTGLSRINVKLKAGEETEINARGPIISPEAIEELLSRLDVAHSGDIVVLSGSVPSSMAKDTYALIMERLSGKGIRFVVDASGELLTKTLKHAPFLIKPNAQELSELYGVEIKTKADALYYARKLQDEGATNVIVSMGKDGAVMLTKDGESFSLDAPNGKVINTVGSGDSMVAGFVHGYVTTNDYLQAFRLGIAAGSASAFLEGLAGKEQIEKVLSTLK